MFDNKGEIHDIEMNNNECGSEKYHILESSTKDNSFNRDNLYQKVLQTVIKGKKTCLRTSFRNKKGSIKELEKHVLDELHMVEEEKKAFALGIPYVTAQNETTTVLEPFYPEERLIVLGGGHVALPVVEFAAKLGFSVILVDDRASFANTARFPLAKQVICDNFEHALDTLEIKESDYVVIITRGHRYDATCLKKICSGAEPGYVGMIGSRRRTAIVKDTLEEEGCNRDRLNRVHTPIGLSIGAITPEEIAISIMAELISFKRIGRDDKKQSNRSDVDYEVIRVLAEEVEIPKASITIISSKGSVPRGAGAKMLVYKDGRILGSIGGGCSEAAVLGIARNLIGTKEYQVLDIDLSGDAAEDEGMVCGGIMTVLIEDL